MTLKKPRRFARTCVYCKRLMPQRQMVRERVKWATRPPWSGSKEEWSPPGWRCKGHDVSARRT